MHSTLCKNFDMLAILDGKINPAVPICNQNTRFAIIPPWILLAFRCLNRKPINAESNNSKKALISSTKIV